MDKIPSREWLLGWMACFFWAMDPKISTHTLNSMTREELYTRYLTAVGKS